TRERAERNRDLRTARTVSTGREPSFKIDARRPAHQMPPPRQTQFLFDSFQTASGSHEPFRRRQPSGRSAEDDELGCSIRVIRAISGETPFTEAKDVKPAVLPTLAARAGEGNWDQSRVAWR